MNPSTPPAGPGRRTLLLVIAVFAAPVVLAWLFANGAIGWLPHARLNYGTLIRPMIDLAALPLRDENGRETHLTRPYGQWTLALVTGGQCGGECRDTLDRMRRIRTALQGDMTRVRPLVLQVGGDRAQFTQRPPDADPALRIWRDPSGKLVSLLAPVAPPESAVPAPDRLILIDYLGNAMMVYPPRPDMEGVLKDLKRLLKASKTES